MKSYVFGQIRRVELFAFTSKMKIEIMLAFFVQLDGTIELLVPAACLDSQDVGDN